MQETIFLCGTNIVFVFLNFIRFFSTRNKPGKKQSSVDKCFFFLLSFLLSVFPFLSQSLVSRVNGRSANDSEEDEGEKVFRKSFKIAPKDDYNAILSLKE